MFFVMRDVIGCGFVGVVELVLQILSFGIFGVVFGYGSLGCGFGNDFFFFIFC